MNGNKNYYFVRAFLSLLFRSRNKVVLPVRTVVVIQNMKMGDMVCTTPLFNALKKNSTGVRVVVCGDAVNEELLKGHPSVDRYIRFVHADIPSVIHALKSESIDVGLTPGPDALAVAVLALSGARSIVAPRVMGGESPYEGRWYKLLRRFVITATHTMGMYAPREYLRLLEPLSIHTDDTSKTLHVSNESDAKASTILGEHSFFVGISPAAGNKIKQWPAERFARVADFLVEQHGARIVVFGSKGDSEEIDTMLRSMNHRDAAIELRGKAGIEELKAVSKRLSLFISADTGPIYIAEAFGVPTVDIVGPVDEREQPPHGPQNVVLVPEPPRVPQLHVLDARSYDPVEARRQAESVSVERVIEAVDTLLKNSSIKK